MIRTYRLAGLDLDFGHVFPQFLCYPAVEAEGDNIIPFNPILRVLTSIHRNFSVQELIEANISAASEVPVVLIRNVQPGISDLVIGKGKLLQAPLICAVRIAKPPGEDTAWDLFSDCVGGIFNANLMRFDVLGVVAILPRLCCGLLGFYPVLLEDLDILPDVLLRI